MPSQDLVMVPGLASDAALWAPSIAALGDAACCTVGNTLEDATLPDMALRILRRAPPTFALAGVSMGGMVALEIMAIAPERVTHLALLDTTARPDTAVQRLRRHIAGGILSTVGCFDRIATRSIGSLVHRSAPNHVRSELAAMTLRVGADVFTRQNHALAMRRDLRPVLPTINVPTAIIVGQEDCTAPPALSREIHALVPGSTLEMVADCGHLPPFERPEVTAALMRRWLMRRKRA